MKAITTGVLTLASCLTASTMVAAEKPNVIVIYIDDMGIGDLGCFGGDITTTPNIDRFADQGLRCTQYYSAAPVSSPSRVGVTTGQFPLRHGINTYLSSRKHNANCEQNDYLDASAPSMARAFQNANYHTAHIGKWHMGGGRDVKNAPSIKKYGFDEYISTYESPDADPAITSTNWIWSATDSVKRWRRTEYFVDKAIEFIERNQEEPFFLNLWPDDMHTPWVPECYADEKRRYEKPEAFIPVLQEMDKQLGRFFDAIHQLGLDDNTIVLFTSDNGPSPSFDQSRALGKRGVKNSLYEGGINMPFIIRYPKKIEAGEVNDEMVLCSVDLYPTLCKMCRIDVESNYKGDGDNYAKVLTGGKSKKRKEDLMWEFGRSKFFNKAKDPYHDSAHLAIRRGDMKLISDDTLQGAELYDLSVDPNETTNIIDQHPELASELFEKVYNWYKNNK